LHIALFDENIEQLTILSRAFLEQKEKDTKIHFFPDEIKDIKRWETWVASMYEKNSSLLATTAI
jgi:predicted AAA+ superfamily ATPase